MKPKSRISVFISAIIVFSCIQGCYYDKEELLYPGSNAQVDCSTISAKFAADVSPIISSKCATATCHDATGQGGYILQNYSQISGAKDAILNSVEQRTMPKTGSLDQSEINKIKCWVESGAPNN